MAQDDVIGRRFSLLRKRAEQDAKKQQQQEDDALKRSFARTGSLGSGASIKTQKQVGEQRAEQMADLQEGFGVAEQAAKQQQAEIQKQRDFQRSERLGSQDFAAKQAALGREFARGERLGSQKFAATEASKQRGFSKKLFDIEQRFKNRQFKESVRQFNKQFGFAEMDAQRKFDLETKVQEFNMDMATKMWNKKDMMEFFANTMGYDPRTGGSSTGNIPGIGNWGGGGSGMWSGAGSLGGGGGGLLGGGGGGGGFL